jgi:hypothetical protein
MVVRKVSLVEFGRKLSMYVLRHRKPQFLFTENQVMGVGSEVEEMLLLNSGLS